MSVETPNVLPLAVAAEQYGIGYDMLRELAHAGVFTKHVFDPAKQKPAIFVPVAELDAWKTAVESGRNGAQAVIELRAKSELARLHTPDLGGEG